MNEVKATPHAELIAKLMNPNIPKNEREHAAVREIERLREALAQPEQEPVAPMEALAENDSAEAYADGWNACLMKCQATPPAAQRAWVGLIRGVRVESDTVVITVKCGNDAARELCGELINEMDAYRGND